LREIALQLNDLRRKGMSCRYLKRARDWPRALIDGAPQNKSLAKLIPEEASSQMGLAACRVDL